MTSDALELSNSPELPYSEFLALNPQVKVSESKDRDNFVFRNLWGDDTVMMIVKKSDTRVFDTLADVLLPERLSAIWHKKEQKLEILYTAYPLQKDDADVITRKFSFCHNGGEHECYFGEASAATLAIARHFRPSGPPTKSDYRNLYSFSQIFALEDVETDTTNPGYKRFLQSFKPICFWIEGVDWHDDRVLDLVNHLNFYMSYYDSSSPTINVHSPQGENIRTQPQTWFLFEKFPDKIVSRAVDINLLHFWQASRVGDPAKRFLYNYQILEYAAFYQLEDAVSKGIKKLLAAPDASSNSEKVVLSIMETLGESKLSDPQKLQWLFRRVVDCKLIWRELCLNKEAFTKATVFDGGFRVAPIIKDGWNIDDFETNWCAFLPDTLRSIRNALSHGRESRMSSVITPTSANFQKLQSWVPIVDVAAREVMVYREAL